MTHQVLGQASSTREMERFTDVRQKLHGASVGSNQQGEVEIDGYPILGSNLGTALRYLEIVPLGVGELGDLLQQQGIAFSKFQEGVRPLLGS